jgi:hypothetical protein
VRSGSQDPGPGGSNSSSSILISLPAAMLILSPSGWRAAPPPSRQVSDRGWYLGLDKILVSP